MYWLRSHEYEKWVNFGVESYHCVVKWVHRAMHDVRRRCWKIAVNCAEDRLHLLEYLFLA